MRGEAPIFKRCCFCIPLRRGILGWGYFKLIVNILAIALYTFLYIAWPYGLSITEVLSTAIFRTVDVSFSILLVIACHKKSPKLLNIYYRYGIVELILIISTTFIIAYVEVDTFISLKARISMERLGSVIISMVASVAAYFVDIFVCIYVLLLVRSERLKLREQNLEMQFVNNAAESEARCVCADNHDTSAKGTNDGHDVSMQYVEDGHDPLVQHSEDGHDLSVKHADDGHNVFVQHANDGHDSCVQYADKEFVV